MNMPPVSAESETAVLSALMLNPDAWDEIADILKPEMFYTYRNQALYESISYLANNGRPIDPITLADCLERSDSDENLTVDDLADVMNAAIGDVNHVAYAKIIRDKYTLRELSTVGHKVIDLVYNKENIEADTVLDMAETQIMAIGDSSNAAKSGPLPMSQIAVEEMKATEERRSNPSILLGLSWGFSDVDRITDGLHDSDFVVVAGRPSMGKTSMVMNVAEHIAINAVDKKPVLVFSMEMPASQLAKRMQSSIARIELNKIRNGSLNNIEWARFAEATNKIEKGSMYVDDTPAQTPGQVRAKARRVNREVGGLGLIVLDYLQLMQTDRSENRATEIAEISRSLKALAKELNVPVIALSQLSRAVESRPDKRPVMSDLRESGAIEQDADVIAFIYRDEVYNPESNWKGTAELLFRKQRNGPTGSVRLSFNGAYTKFGNWVDDRYSSYGNELEAV